MIGLIIGDGKNEFIFSKKRKSKILHDINYVNTKCDDDSIITDTEKMVLIQNFNKKLEITGCVPWQCLSSDTKMIKENNKIFHVYSFNIHNLKIVCDKLNKKTNKDQFYIEEEN